jgi:beta-lactamase class A
MIIPISWRTCLAGPRMRVATCAAAACLVSLGAAAVPAGASAGSGTGVFGSAAMRRFLASRHGNITAAVDDLTTGQEFLYRPGVREETASIVKAAILATLLHRTQRRSLTASERATARGMIEASDNNDATRLWNEDGGSAGVGAFLRAAGLRQTTFAGPGLWGLTRTTPIDQIRLLRTIVLPNRLLRASARSYELGLMSHVIGMDYWGVSGGIPPGVPVALKDGWLPQPGIAWQINSIGEVRGNGEHYLIAVMTNGNGSERYGISTISGISRIIWRELAPIIA